MSGDTIASNIRRVSSCFFIFQYHFSTLRKFCPLPDGSNQLEVGCQLGMVAEYLRILGGILWCIVLKDGEHPVAKAQMIVAEYQQFIKQERVGRVA